MLFKVDDFSVTRRADRGVTFAPGFTLRFTFGIFSLALYPCDGDPVFESEYVGLLTRLSCRA